MVPKRSLLIFLCFFALTGHAQQYSTSPFSTQGLGEAGGLDDAQFGGIGHCRTATGDSISVNLYNPSSYPMLIRGLPLFAIGVSGRFSEYSQSGVTATGRTTGLNQIAMVLPLGNRFGMAVGLQPFSRKGYDISDNEVLGTGDTIFYNYRGSGTTQQVTGGFAYQPLDLKRSKFYIGANYSYIFGSVTNERRSALDDDNSGGVDQQTYRLHGAQYTVGMTYDQMLDTMDRQHLVLSAVLIPQQKLRAHSDYFLFYSNDVANPNLYDTLSYTVDDKGYILYPSTISLGFSYSIRPKRDVDYKLKSIWQLNIFGDYTSTMWSTYDTDFSEAHGQAIQFANSSRYALGLQFTPNYESNLKATGSSYLNRVRYRAGAYYGQLPNLEGGRQLLETGVTVGFGLPIALQKTNSSFNFSFQYGTRGSDQPDGLSERFFGFSAGVILAPSNQDRWFRKFKVD